MRRFVGSRAEMCANDGAASVAARSARSRVHVCSTSDFAEGAEAAMARLLRSFVSRANELGRDNLLVPLDHLPKLAAEMESLKPELDTRALRWNVKDPAITRPYTDLRYW